MDADEKKVLEPQEFWHTAFSRLQDRLNYDPEDKRPEFDAGALSALRLMRESDLPVPLRAINQFSRGGKHRIYRTLLPPQLLVQFDINPITWRGPDGDGHVVVVAPPEKGLVKVEARHAVNARDPFASLELVDNNFNGINVVLVNINDPSAPRFDTDVSPEGEPTLFGTVHRNLEAEEAAMEAGLAPAQVRRGLRASALAGQHLEAFLMLLGHEAYYAEPLTYATAILFEQRGFSYISGRRRMQQIDREFRPGGRLHTALDGSTPFRRPDQWRTVRGRAWAIHDGILSAIEEDWNGIRMSKRLGRDAGVETFPDAVY
ncbi:MAG: hypothetical protein R3248_12250 [Candidatus Promineifilaceae bacterium]|nr:hypothetical protein [Candidatus Promineifilaceae bacterium]